MEWGRLYRNKYIVTIRNCAVGQLRLLINNRIYKHFITYMEGPKVQTSCRRQKITLEHRKYIKWAAF